MLADSLRKPVLIASNAETTGRFVLIVVILCLQQFFKFLNGSREFDPIAPCLMLVLQ